MMELSQCDATSTYFGVLEGNKKPLGLKPTFTFITDYSVDYLFK